MLFLDIVILGRFEKSFFPAGGPAQRRLLWSRKVRRRSEAPGRLRLDQSGHKEIFRDCRGTSALLRSWGELAVHRPWRSSSASSVRPVAAIGASQTILSVLDRALQGLCARIHGAPWREHFRLISLVYVFQEPRLCHGAGSENIDSCSSVGFSVSAMAIKIARSALAGRAFRFRRVSSRWQLSGGMQQLSPRSRSCVLRSDFRTNPTCL